MLLSLHTGCGNKGDLYLEIDPITREQIDQAAEQIQQGAGAPGAGAEVEATTNPEASGKREKEKTRRENR